MTQEEKAKAYDEALERAKQFSEHPLLEDSGAIVEYIFPELAESEDERIRKAVIEMIHDTHSIECEENYNVRKEDVLVWLEKQGEKPQGKTALEAINEEKVDNQNCIKPKFKESITDYERGYIDGRKAMAEKIQIILNAILFDNEKNEKDDNYNHPVHGCIIQSRADD